MNWLEDPDRVLVQRRIVLMNLTAAIVNILIGLWVWKWISLANLFSAGFSGWVAWGAYQKIPAITREQEQRILDYLKGS